MPRSRASPVLPESRADIALEAMPGGAVPRLEDGSNPFRAACVYAPRRAARVAGVTQAKATIPSRLPGPASAWQTHRCGRVASPVAPRTSIWAPPSRGHRPGRRCPAAVRECVFCEGATTRWPAAWWFPARSAPRFAHGQAPTRSTPSRVREGSRGHGRRCHATATSRPCCDA